MLDPPDENTNMAAGKVTFKLNHISHLKGCEGSIGDVIDVSKEDAEMLLSRKGGEIVDADGKPVRKAEGKKQKAESDENTGDGEQGSSGDGK